MLSELWKIIWTDNLNSKTIAEWSPMLLQAQTASKLGQDALSLYYINLVGKAEKQWQPVV